MGEWARRKRKEGRDKARDRGRAGKGGGLTMRDVCGFGVVRVGGRMQERQN